MLHAAGGNIDACLIYRRNAGGTLEDAVAMAINLLETASTLDARQSSLLVRFIKEYAGYRQTLEERDRTAGAASFSKNKQDLESDASNSKDIAAGSHLSGWRTQA